MDLLLKRFLHCVSTQPQCPYSLLSLQCLILLVGGKVHLLFIFWDHIFSNSHSEIVVEQFWLYTLLLPDSLIVLSLCMLFLSKYLPFFNI